jgi:predicted DNA-binding protein YlxM (UPF0122 family)
MFSQEKIDFTFTNEDFTPEGSILFSALPNYTAVTDKNGFIVNKDEFRKYHLAKDKNEYLVRFSSYQDKEQLWENFERLSPNQQKALHLFISGNSLKDIADKCKVNDSTIYRWLQLDIFIQCLKLWQKNLLFEADYKIKKVVEKGLEKLEFILDNPDKFEGKDYLKAIELSLGLMGKNI